MSEKATPSQSTTKSGAIFTWTSTQAYILAAFCLLLGVALGYLFRGSASVDTAQAATAMTAQQTSGVQPQPDANAVAKAAAPLL